ncbi:helix-turn-helix domain-containing protein [Halomarina oriensis]|uniref:DNA-binding protein n=1 Tax=Halomarina oriensis TaxID=671145 RepID=A0A6B0GRG9_9EURY|nr:helix-turn-helix domain-containing protein [Halomarina oriensis]MWG35967.1 DNA-binding protein [Halomarina oriensis]
MGTMTEVRIPAPEFALHETLRSVPSTGIEVQRVVADESRRLVPHLWVTTDDFETVHRSFERDRSVDDLSTLSTVDGERLYRMSWVSDVELVAHALVEQDGTVLSARGSGDEWRLRLFFPARDALRRTNEYAEREGWSLTVDSVYETSDPSFDRYGLTDRQHETLVVAHERGYYEFPHAVTTAELGDEFDISAQAAADRLRRGHGNLVERALLTDELDTYDG